MATLMVFPAALVSGYQFPLLVALVGKGRKDVARDVGATYAANTLGSIVGSLAGGFGLLPALGAIGYELSPTRIVLSLASDTGLDPSRVMKLVSGKASRYKLTPDMRLAYNFDDREKLDRMTAARARLQQLRGLVAR